MVLVVLKTMLNFLLCGHFAWKVEGFWPIPAPFRGGHVFSCLSWPSAQLGDAFGSVVFSDVPRQTDILIGPSGVPSSSVASRRRAPYFGARIAGLSNN